MKISPPLDLARVKVTPRATHLSKSLLIVVLFLVGCSSSNSDGPATPDAGGTLYGICPLPALDVANLWVSTADSLGFTLPVSSGQTEDVTFLVTNYGADATQIKDLTPQSSMFAYKGGTYPGEGGTCTDRLERSASCTLVATLVAPTTGQSISLVILQYYNGMYFTTTTHQVEAVVTPDTFTTAPHAPLPSMPRNGGEVLDKVSFVSISFSDTPVVDSIDTFGDWLVSSDYWKTIGKDYGVGPGTHQHVKLDKPAPHSLSNSEFATRVDAQIASGELPSLPEAVYVFFLSRATTVTDIADAGGWHDRTPGGHYYAVVLPGCTADDKDILAQYVFVSSHELIETATDPSPLSGFNFGFGMAEVGDLCDQPISQGAYVLPTIWSNSAAAMGGDPCVPRAGQPYVDVDPSPSIVHLASQAGSTADVTLTGWSTARVGDWLIQLSVHGTGMSGVTATLDPDATDLINNGRSVHLQVKTDGSAPKGSTGMIEIAALAPWGVKSVQGVQLIPVLFY